MYKIYDTLRKVYGLFNARIIIEKINRVHEL